jgi:glycosyltransferase involved in cell wall biosynthesis
MRIAIVSTTRYPTEKAYGVTIQHTAAALRNLGHDSRIYGPGTGCIDNSGNQVVGIMRLKTSQEFIKSLLRGKKFLFAARSIILAVRFKISTKNEEFELIWLRDCYFAATLRCLKVKVPVLIEIHHIPEGGTLRILRWLSKKNTGIATLTPTHLQKLTKLNLQGPMCISPMGVPSDFYIDPKLKKEVSPSSFGYVGKAISSGSDNRLDVLVDEFRIAQSEDSKLRLTLVGLEKTAIESLMKSEGLSQRNSQDVDLIGNVPHSEVIKHLKNFYCGILPYMDSQYNSMRFPIKVLEYAASGTHIIASDIPAHRALLTDSLATFYKPDLKGSLADAISYVRHNKEDVSQKIQNAYEWAGGFTYENRVRQALNCISDLEMG